MPEISSGTQQKLLAASVPFGGETIEFTFDANAITPRWMETTLVEGLLQAVTAWNMTENDQPLPFTQENLERLPIPVLGEMTRELIRVSSPSSEEGNASSTSGVSPEATTSTSDSPSSPNGSDTSTSQKSSESLSTP